MSDCYIACKIGIRSAEQMNPITTEIKEIPKMLTGLTHSIKARVKPCQCPGQCLQWRITGILPTPPTPL